MDGIMYLLDQTGVALAQANAEISRLREEEHIVASGSDWTWKDAAHAITCAKCLTWGDQAREWVKRHVDD